MHMHDKHFILKTTGSGVVLTYADGQSMKLPQGELENLFRFLGPLFEDIIIEQAKERIRKEVTNEYMEFFKEQNKKFDIILSELMNPEMHPDLYKDPEK
jgi:hypothetical protein